MSLMLLVVQGVMFAKFKVINNLISSKLFDPSVKRCVGRKFTTSNPFLDLQMSSMDRSQPKISLTYKNILFSCQ